MISKHITHPAPLNDTIAYIHSDLEWGNSREENLRFEIENGIVVMSYDGWDWAVGKPIKEIEDYIQAAEEKHIARVRRIHENFLIKQQQDFLLWEQEKKKRRIWEEEHWIETEQGDGYFAV